ncbi:hypothetical protein [Kineococcus terrestris]|uniref:hypothetical protein n=1 Tax=Kineococcus terrestris TaxID=2044856 RepID=UPI0034DB7878
MSGAAVLRELHRVGPLRTALTAALVAGYAILLTRDAAVRHAEACASAALVRATGTAATCAGDSTLYRVEGLLVGHTTTIGCSALVLLLPFVAVTALLLPVRRVPLVVPVGALATAAVVVVAVNQLRLLTIASGVRAWGLERGYGATHVLAGTVVSTVGVIAGGLVFLVLIVRGSRLLARAEVAP